MSTGAAFLAAGARAVIGTLWPVANDLAVHVGTRIADQMHHQELALALMNASTGHPDAAAYLYIGLPRLLASQTFEGGWMTAVASDPEDQSALAFYEDFAAEYHLMWDDWWAAAVRHGWVLGAVLAAHGVVPPAAVLDCSCASVPRRWASPTAGTP